MGKYQARVDDHLVLPATVFLPRGHARVLRLLGRPVQDLLSVRLLIDTGSKRSSLIPEIIDRLKPRQAGRVRIETAYAWGRASLHWVRLEFPGTSLQAISEIPVARLALPPSLSRFHGLIGRDLLHRWESFHYQGRRRLLTIRDTPGGLFGWLLR
jgi:hypothetical protein